LLLSLALERVGCKAHPETQDCPEIPEAQAIPDYPDYPASTAPLAPQALKGRAAPRASEDLPDQPALRELPVPHIR